MSGEVSSEERPEKEDRDAAVEDIADKNDSAIVTGGSRGGLRKTKSRDTGCQWRFLCSTHILMSDNAGGAAGCGESAHLQKHRASYSSVYQRDRIQLGSRILGRNTSQSVSPHTAAEHDTSPTRNQVGAIRGIAIRVASI